MEPALSADMIVIASGLLPVRAGDVVILHHDGLEKIKRIEKLKNQQVFVIGDNDPESTDSRVFGWLPESTVVAKVIWPRIR